MMNKIIAACILVLCLSACTNLQNLEKKGTAANSAFNQALAEEYLGYAQKEAGIYDWIDSSFLAKKGLRATKGKQVKPEELRHWYITKPFQADLQWGYDRLMAVWTDETKQSRPKQLAKVQRLYDCWMEEQEESWQAEAIETCRLNFLLEMSKLEQDLGLGKTPKVARRVTKDVYVQPNVVFNERKLYFDFDSDKVKDQDIVNQITQRVDSMKEYIVRISGHADRSGPKEYNDKLSNRRAIAVSEKLIAQGVNVRSDDLYSYGENYPAQPTVDGVANPKNRRVEVNIQGIE